MPRLFTGLEVPEDIGHSLAALRGGLPGARWIDPENYHLTLRFIGDIDGIAANEIASMLFRVHRKPFEVTLQGLSSFGGKKPRAVVAAVAPSRPLMELQAELERLLQRVGLDPEGRKFTPHVTLARLRDASNRDVADYLSVPEIVCCGGTWIVPKDALAAGDWPTIERLASEAAAIVRRTRQ